MRAGCWASRQRHAWCLPQPTSPHAWSLSSPPLHFYAGEEASACTIFMCCPPPPPPLQFYAGEVSPEDLPLVPPPSEPPSAEFLDQLRQYTPWRLRAAEPVTHLGAKKR